MYTVKEVARMIALSEHTIRYYTDQGLIPSVQRDKNNIRLFDEESLNWFIGVKYLKECGMSLKDIKEYVSLCLAGDHTIQQRYQLILHYKAIACKQRQEAQKRLAYMTKKAQHYAEIVKSMTPDDTNPIKWDKNNAKR